METVSTYICTPQNNPLVFQMKTQLITALSISALFLVACGPNEAEVAAKKAQATADSLAVVAAAEHAYTIDPGATKVTWKGVMLGVKQHHGVVNISEGKASVKGGQLQSGTVVIDMTTISSLDSAYAADDAKQGTRAMLIGHLTSPDFFDVATYPTATFTITSVEGNTATGDLTVKGKTNSEKVTDIVVTEGEGTVSISGKLTFDRQKFGVAWSSGAKDMVLSDTIELTVELSGTAQ